jgi:plasmid stability protein
MSKQTLTVPVPDRLLTRIRDRARKANRTVEAEVVDLLTVALSGNNGVTGKGGKAGRGGNANGDVSDDEDELPPDIAEAIAGMDQLDEASLRRAALAVLTPKQSKRLAVLNRKNQAEGLTRAERHEQRDLLHLYERALVVRATALGELHKRGLDISDLIGS